VAQEDENVHEPNTTPRYVEILHELPRTAFGRVVKHILRAREQAYQVWDLEALGFSVAAANRGKPHPRKVGS
jgi:hypothetical protein